MSSSFSRSHCITETCKLKARLVKQKPLVKYTSSTSSKLNITYLDLFFFFFFLVHPNHKALHERDYYSKWARLTFQKIFLPTLGPLPLVLSLRTTERIWFHLPSVGNAPPNTAQDTIRLPCSKGTLLAYGQLAVHKDTQVLCCKAVFQSMDPSTHWCTGLFLPSCRTSTSHCWTAWCSCQLTFPACHFPSEEQCDPLVYQSLLTVL